MEDFVGDGLSFGGGLLGICQPQIAQRGAAQARDGKIEDADVEPGEPKRSVGKGPKEERGYCIQPPPRTRSPE